MTRFDHWGCTCHFPPFPPRRRPFIRRGRVRDKHAGVDAQNAAAGQRRPGPAAVRSTSAAPVPFGKAAAAAKGGWVGGGGFWAVASCTWIEKRRLKLQRHTFLLVALSQSRRYKNGLVGALEIARTEGIPPPHTTHIGLLFQHHIHSPSVPPKSTPTISAFKESSGVAFPSFLRSLGRCRCWNAKLGYTQLFSFFANALANSESYTVTDPVADPVAHTVTDTKPDPESHAWADPIAVTPRRFPNRSRCRHVSRSHCPTTQCVAALPTRVALFIPQCPPWRASASRRPGLCAVGFKEPPRCTVGRRRLCSEGRL